MHIVSCEQMLDEPCWRCSDAPESRCSSSSSSCITTGTLMWCLLGHHSAPARPSRLRSRHVDGPRSRWKTTEISY